MPSNNGAFADATSDAFTLIEPFIKTLSHWPDVDAPVYVVVVEAPAEPRRELVVTDLERDDWPVPFDELARAKAALTARTRLPSRAVLQDQQQLLQAGDPRWFGSAIDPVTGVLVAASGGPEDIDELIAETVLKLISVRAVLSARDQIQQRGPDNKYFGRVQR